MSSLLLQAPSAFTLSPPADEIAGPASIITILDGYNALIPDNLTRVTQVKYEISSLTGYIGQWRRRHCGEQGPKPLLSGALQKLESRKDYTLTVGIEALMRVKEFLNLVLKNLDQLETCWKNKHCDQNLYFNGLILWRTLHQWCLRFSLATLNFCYVFWRNFIFEHAPIYTHVYLFIYLIYICIYLST